MTIYKKYKLFDKSKGTCKQCLSVKLDVDNDLLLFLEVILQPI